ncbi:MAG: sensor histidine kinase, partial [Vicinamibacteraceae bacterium]
EWTPLTAMPGGRAIAAVPFLVGSRCLGAVGLSFTRRRRFDDRDRAFLQALAHQAALALERARLQGVAQRAQAAAEAASLAKDEFLAALSHELRTPLNAILAWAQMLRAGRVEPEVVPRALEAIEQNARTQARLVKDLVDVSRAVSGRLQHAWEAVDLGVCLEAALGTVRPAADDKRLTLVVRREEREARVRGDTARLQQVFWNLLTNAIKFTPAGGRVDVALGYTADEAIIRVTDSGDGMEPERVPAMFERFSQADSSPSRSQEGLGLGLAIVRHLIEAHQGSVHATSEGRGHGSTFVIRLPLDHAVEARDRTSVHS